MPVTQQSLKFAKQNLSIRQLTSTDARRQTDLLSCLRELVVSSEEMYPDIKRWFDHKVIPGILQHKRSAFVALVGDVPVASAIVKRGERSKFCHLKIAADMQDQNLG